MGPEYAKFFEDQVGVRHLKTLIGSGADHLGPEEIGRVPFRRSWLLYHGIDPTQCYMVKVMGDSMAPTLPDGCLVLVNPGGKDRKNDRIYLVRSSKGLVARRVKMGPDGSQVMAPDNATLNDPVWPPDEDVLGELVWMARVPPRQNGGGRSQSRGIRVADRSAGRGPFRLRASVRPGNAWRSVPEKPATLGGSR